MSRPEMIMKCASCGADCRSGETFCGRCGADLPKLSADTGRAARAAVYAAIEKSPEFAAKDSPERRAALPKISPMASIIPLVFVPLVFAVGAVMLALVIPKMIKVIPWIIIVPIGFAVVGVCVVVKVIRWANNLRSAPVLARAAVVTGVRVAKNASHGTDYFITCEFSDGTSAEYVTYDDDLSGRVSEQDAGVLFSQAVVALDFDHASN